MHHHGVALANLIENAQGLTAFDHVVLGDDLEPVDLRRALQDLRIMLRPEA
jgi:hypothetical protein